MKYQIQFAIITDEDDWNVLRNGDFETIEEIKIRLADEYKCDEERYGLDNKRFNYRVVQEIDLPDSDIISQSNGRILTL